jgi:hypothetical protein
VNPAARLFLASCAAFVLIWTAADLWLYLRRGPAATVSTGIRGAAVLAKCLICAVACLLFGGLFCHWFAYQY